MRQYELWFPERKSVLLPGCVLWKCPLMRVRRKGFLRHQFLPSVRCRLRCFAGQRCFAVVLFCCCVVAVWARTSLNVELLPLLDDVAGEMPWSPGIVGGIVGAMFIMVSLALDS